MKRTVTAYGNTFSAAAFWVIGLILPCRHAEDGYAPEKKLYLYGAAGVGILLGAYTLVQIFM
jgi:hypothetical protein